MENFNGFAGHPVKYLVSIAPDDLYTDIWIIRSLSSRGTLCYKLYAGING